MGALAGAGWVAIVSCASRGDVLLDQIEIALGYRYDFQIGNAIGGDFLGDNGCYALRLADDFRTTDQASVIVQVEVGNLFVRGHHDVQDARVSVFRDLGGYPSDEAVYSMRVSEMTARSPVAPLGIVNENFDDIIWQQFYGVRTTITGLWIPLEPDTGYFICVQVDAGPEDWAFTCVDWDDIVGADSYGSDGPPEEGCRGGWNHEGWKAVGDLGRAAGTAYRVVAIGEPRPAPGDFNRDGAVNTQDVLAYLDGWSARDPKADLDGDGTVNTLDFLEFLNAWSAGC